MNAHPIRSTRLRVHTNFDIDAFLMGDWVVEVDGRVVKKGNAFACARYAAEIRRLNPDLDLDTRAEEAA